MPPKQENHEDVQPQLHLNYIKDKSFTKREIDVIACLVCGRATSIPRFLSISARTVDTHIHNITLKLACKTRAAIIEFVEQSNELPLIRQHYQSLVGDMLCVKALKAIATFVKAKKRTCTLLDEHDAHLNHTNMLHKLIKHLAFLNVDVKLGKHNELTPFHISASVDTATDPAFTLSVLSKEQYEAQSGVGEANVSDENVAGTAHLIYMRLDQRDSKNPSAEMKTELFSCKTYYDAIFTISKKLYPNHNIDAFITDFNTHYASLGHDNQQSSSAEIAITEAILSSNTIHAPTTWLKANLRLGYARTYVFLLILIIAIAFLFGVHTSDQGERSVSHTKSAQSVRSDLRVPVESAFLDRPILLNQLNDHFKKESANTKIRVVGIVGLVGIGGAGKTTLARSYAKAQTNSVVWEINAETHTSLVDSFMNLATALAQTKELKDELTFIKAIQNADEKEKQLVVFVKVQLKAQPKWLLVYDNVEAFSQIKEFFPHDVATWGGGDVIITTRDSNIINSTHIGEDNVIQIDQLSPDEALALFCKILYQKEPKDLAPEGEEKVRAFLTKIPPFPLDVSVAAYYIKNAGITLDQYAVRVAQNSQAFDKGQQSLLKEISDYTQTRYELITLSITKLIELNPEYKDLLFLICLLDSQDIPLNLLAFYKEPSLVDQFLRDLKKYSLITSQTGGDTKSTEGTFSLHRSTQLLTKGFLMGQLSNKEKVGLLAQYAILIKNFYRISIEKNYKIISYLIPHLEVMLKNLDVISSKKNTEKYMQDILYVLSYAHNRGSRNLLKEKKYFMQNYKMQQQNNHLSDIEMAALLKSLSEICVDLDSNDEAISYARKSLDYCSRISQSNILRAETLRMVGYAYTRKNDFENARHAFNEALNQISGIDLNVKREVEAGIYTYMGLLYITVHVNNETAIQGIQYAYKGLEMLDGTHVYYNDKQKPKNKISCGIPRIKSDLGRIHNALGKYKEGFEYFKDAEHIMDNSLTNCVLTISKLFTKIGLGENYLRLGELKVAKERLIKCIVEAEKLTGQNNNLTFPSRIFCAEARIRLGEFDKAYQDCLFVLDSEQKVHTNYLDLIVLTAHYHAAVIKQKLNDHKKTYEHFKDFFDKIKPICKAILADHKYNTLEENKAFDAPSFQEDTSKDSIKRCFQQSALIFSTIYGEEHPFVRDYVMVNNNFG